HPQGLQLISRLFFEMIEEEDATAIGGLTLGADPLVAGLMLHAGEAGRNLEGVLVRRGAKEHGKRGQGEGNPAGHQRVILLDDAIARSRDRVTTPTATKPASPESGAPEPAAPPAWETIPVAGESHPEPVVGASSPRDQARKASLPWVAVALVLGGAALVVGYI